MDVLGLARAHCCIRCVCVRVCGGLQTSIWAAGVLTGCLLTSAAHMLFWAQPGWPGWSGVSSAGCGPPPSPASQSAGDQLVLECSRTLMGTCRNRGRVEGGKADGKSIRKRRGKASDLQLQPRDHQQIGTINHQTDNQTEDRQLHSCLLCFCRIIWTADVWVSLPLP